MDKDETEVTLKEFLAQPVPIASGEVSPADGGLLAFGQMPLSVFQNHPFITRKLNGYLGFRATVRYRLVVNAPKSLAGRLVMAFIPNAAPTSELPNDYQDHQRITQLPHVQLDVNTETEAVLEIPYRNPHTHYDMLTGEGAFGWITIRQLLPTRGTGSFSWTLYTSFVDTDLASPTVIAGINAQSNIDLGNTDHAKEAKNVPLSERVMTVSRVATALGNIPVLSTVAQPLSWATAVSSKVLSALGYSRPLAQTSPELRVVRDLPQVTQSDGVDWAESLALTRDTRIQPMYPLGITSQDEMSIAYLAGIKSSIHRAAFTINTEVGTRLITIPLAPAYMAARSGVYPDTIVAHPTYMLEKCFGQYRGSYEVSITFAKTIFHTARIMAVFEPGSVNSTVRNVPSVDTLEKAYTCHRDLLDLRQGHDFSFVCPYTALTPYLLTFQPYGFLHLFLVSPLKVAGDASSSVDYLVSVRGMEDFEFTSPTIPNVFPYVPNTANPAEPKSLDNQTLLSNIADNPDPQSNIVYQGGLEVDRHTVISKPIGRSHEPSESVLPAATCIGEKILSIKQLIMTSKMVSTTGQDMPADPFGLWPLTHDATPERATVAMRDWISFFGWCYAFNRGGIVYTMWNRSGATPYRLSIHHKTETEQTFNNADQGDMCLAAYVCPRQGARLYVPPHQTGLCRFRYDGQLTGNGSLQQNPGVSRVRTFFSTVAGDGNPNVYVLRAAADDYQLGYFTGVPLLSAINTPNTGGVLTPTFDVSPPFWPSSDIP